MDVLPEVMDAVRGRARVMIDGSFARGTDVVKAIALGADAVAVGRLYCYALAAEGDVGVHRLLEILEQEVMVAMALSGARSLAELNRSFLHFGVPPVTAPHVHSAFPLLFSTPETPVTAR
jgi:glycolate oxidase